MEWTTVQHLDLRHVDRGLKPLQPHAAAFHPTQALVAAAIGTYIVEFDAVSGSKISVIDIGSPVVRMEYSPTIGNAVVAILQSLVSSPRSFDFRVDDRFVVFTFVGCRSLLCFCVFRNASFSSSDILLCIFFTPLVACASSYWLIVRDRAIRDLPRIRPCILRWFAYHVCTNLMPSNSHNHILVSRSALPVLLVVDSSTRCLSVVNYVDFAVCLLCCPVVDSVDSVVCSSFRQLCSVSRSVDFALEQTCVLHSPEKRMEQISSDTEVHLALTPLQPVVFFGFHRRMSVTVVGTIEGGRAPTKIKTDLKKPIVNLACHPRLPILYVAYAEGLIRAYNIQTYAVNYTLQLDNTIKLTGAGAFAFHPTLEWVFVGDRRGTLLAWDVSTERPSMIGITQVGLQPISAIAWLPILRLLVTLSKDGNLQQGGEAVYPLPRIKALAVHPKLNLTALLFAGETMQRIGQHSQGKAGNSFLQFCRVQEVPQIIHAVTNGAVHECAYSFLAASVMKEKLSALGSSGVLADHQFQMQLQEHHLKGFKCEFLSMELELIVSCLGEDGGFSQSQLTVSDIARKAFLHSHFLEGHSKTVPISRLPLITISDSNHLLKDFPICQPFHLELNFFNKENRVLHYPVRAFYIDGLNLMAYNLCSGADSIYKKLYTSLPGNIECYSKSILYSTKQHLFLVVFEFSGATNEVVVYWENTNFQSANTKESSIKGRDAAFIGPSENQFAILDNDKTGLALYILPGEASQETAQNNGASDTNTSTEANVSSIKGPLQFMFEDEVDRIFSSPLESTIMYASHGSHIGLTKLIQGYRLSVDDDYDSRFELAECFYFRSLLWVGPALLFSIATAINVLGWDSKVRRILSISLPYAGVLIGALNDRLLLANPMDINPRQKKGVEIRSCLVGLLEPLLIGFATMQQTFEQKIDLPEILYQITSRFDSLRITPRSLDILSGGSPVCGDLALSLSQAGPQFTQVLRCIYATKALRFSTALSVLKDEFLRSRDYPQCPPTSHLFHRFRHLGYACIKYGQFDSAKETFEVIADFESMLDLFICHLNPSAMRRLAQKLEDAGTDSELRRYCDRILRVRSSGWTQGIFANFAAESMIPKGPEWGGGNWEIKTPTSLKDIPQWELAGEVMPYMKTNDGSIPSIIADHIGVYLGAIKGRGNVIEVREGSLVKAFKAGGADKKKANEVQASVSNLPARATTGDAKIDSLMGLDTRTKQVAGVTAGDEQAKAEEEFKRSLYGAAADGSSSDEDEAVSKAKKIRIRIRDKPVEAIVDVNKIKEATKQFKLGDGLGLPTSRPKSSSGGSQDLGLILSQPASITAIPATSTTTVSAPPADLFGTDSLALAPAAQPVGAVSAGPIPEDFFQNTISSLQVAATLSQPGSYIFRSDQTTPVSDRSQVTTTSQSNGTTDMNLPTQAPQQPSVSLESIGLPDGGVPPQTADQLTMPPQLQAQTAPLTQVPVSSQPIDLSSLEPPGSVSGGKPTARPTSPPSSVRPGQVPRGAAASICFKTGLAHLEQNQLSDALSCFDEAFLALAKDQSRGADIKAQATICAQYKIAVALLQEIGRLMKVQGSSALSAKDEMARLSRHLGSLPLRAHHRINCVRTAIKRNMEVQNFAYAKQMLELLLSKAPPSKQDELRSLVDMCVQRGNTNKSIDPLEDPSHFCAATLSRLSTIGYDVCDLCGAKFSALTTPGCIICGMGSIKRSDAIAAPVPSPFGARSIGVGEAFRFQLSNQRNGGRYQFEPKCREVRTPTTPSLIPPSPNPHSSNSNPNILSTKRRLLLTSSSPPSPSPLAIPCSSPTRRRPLSRCPHFASTTVLPGKRRAPRAALELKALGACDGSSLGLAVHHSACLSYAEIIAAVNGVNRSYLFVDVKCHAPFAPALYVFGDSIVDSGNNNYLQTPIKVNYKPYGVDFPFGATGRFTNGKTVADYVAQSLGLPFAPPYLGLSSHVDKRRIITGVNYASGSAGILPESGTALVCPCVNIFA
ncbi:hypothetical protein Sjap_022211 [Stephania japonica]|uniref:Transducin/WD40 repeat-like superfamily protein n=1 Tax=Stephania japonica TaxID=461633 RepID=A0AAP0EXA5_9MAGN